MNVNKLLKFFKISIIKTLHFNIHYFGIQSLFSPKVFCGRSVVFKKMGGNCVYNKIGGGRATIGIEENVIFSGYRNKTIFYNLGTLELSGKCCISRGCSIKINKNAKLTIENGFHMSQISKIECRKNIQIGKDVTISFDCLIMDSDTHFIYDADTYERINDDSRIVIGNHCWICCNSFICKGSIIPDDSIVAAYSKVTQKLKTAHCIYANNKEIKNNISFKM